MSDDETDDGVAVAESHTVVVAAESERLPEVRRGLSSWAERIGMSAEQVEALTLASYEALSNAAAHAYAPCVDGTIEVAASYQPESALVQVTVTDNGRWRRERSTREGIGGRGLMLIRSLAEHAEVHAGATGTTVCMSWTVRSAAATRPAGSTHR